MPRRYWLMKTEPDVYGFDDLWAQPDHTDHWDGIRNYQARNLMRDDMQVGDGVLVYHSRSKPPHVAGVAEIARAAYPDPTSWDPASKYFDPKSSPDNVRWVMVDVKAIRKLPVPLSLDDLRGCPALAEMGVLRRGNRLSIQPVTEDEFEAVLRLADETASAQGG